MHHIPRAEDSRMSSFHSTDICWYSPKLWHLLISQLPGTFAILACPGACILFLSSVLLTPVNFNDYDTSVDSMNAIIMKVPGPGEKWEADENEVRSNYCLPPKLPKFAVSPYQCLSTPAVCSLNDAHLVRGVRMVRRKRDACSACDYPWNA